MILSMAGTRGDNESNNEGVRDASASQALGMLFFYSFFLLLKII